MVYFVCHSCGWMRHRSLSVRYCGFSCSRNWSCWMHIKVRLRCRRSHSRIVRGRSWSREYLCAGLCWSRRYSTNTPTQANDSVNRERRSQAAHFVWFLRSHQSYFFVHTTSHTSLLAAASHFLTIENVPCYMSFNTSRCKYKEIKILIESIELSPFYLNPICLQCVSNPKNRSLGGNCVYINCVCLMMPALCYWWQQFFVALRSKMRCRLCRTIARSVSAACWSVKLERLRPSTRRACASASATWC